MNLVHALATVLPVTKPPDGFDAPGLEIFETGCLIGKGDYCLNRIGLLMILGAVIVCALFIVAFRKPKLVPTGLQNLLEAGVDFIRNDIAKEVIGQEGVRYVPLLASIFFTVFFWNIFGIIPGIQLPATSRMAIPLILAMLVWLVFNAAGMKHQGVGHYFRNTLFPPGVPKALYLLLTPIEFVSVFLVRPLTLSVRLLANMMAGHLILTIFFLGSYYLMFHVYTIPFGIASFAMGTALIGFEMLVAVLQAYIFTILTAVYIGGAIHPDH